MVELKVEELIDISLMSISSSGISVMKMLLKLLIVFANQEVRLTFD